MKNKIIIYIKSFLYGTIFMGLSITFLNAQHTQFKITESEKFTDPSKIMGVLAVHNISKDQIVIARFLKDKLIFNVFDSNVKNIVSQSSSIHKKEKFFGELLYGNELKIFTIGTESLYCYALDIEKRTIQRTKLLKY